MKAIRNSELAGSLCIILGLWSSAALPQAYPAKPIRLFVSTGPGAPPDGYTLGIFSMGYTTAPSMLAQMPYDTERDLAPVTMLARDSNLLVVPSSSSPKSVAELVAAAKARPGFLKFASGGNSTPAHLAGELFKRETGTDIVHIPYKTPPAGAAACSPAKST